MLYRMLFVRHGPQRSSGSLWWCALRTTRGAVLENMRCVRLSAETVLSNYKVIFERAHEILSVIGKSGFIGGIEYISGGGFPL